MFETKLKKRLLEETTSDVISNGRRGQTRIVHAGTIDEAVRLLTEHGDKAKLLAGGLDVIGLMKNRISIPEILVNIKPIERLKFMAASAEGISIGSTIHIKEIERSELVRSKLPMLAEAARLIGSPHVRNMATLGGNLCQETRCWYFRRSPETGLTFQCHRKDNTGICFAREGENPYHAVMGYETCVSSFPSDLGVVLSAMDAQVKTSGPDGGRMFPIDRLYSNDGLNLHPDEIITSVMAPNPHEDVRWKFIKFRVRKSIDFAIISVAASIRLKDGHVEDARICLGGAAPKPFRASKAEASLMGERLSEPVIHNAADQAVADIRPLNRNAYKGQLIRVLVRRAVIEAQAGGRDLQRRRSLSPKKEAAPVIKISAVGLIRQCRLV